MTLVAGRGGNSVSYRRDFAIDGIRRRAERARLMIAPSFKRGLHPPVRIGFVRLPRDGSPRDGRRGDHEIVRLAADTVELLQGDAAIRIGFTREVERPLESRVVFEVARLARERRRWICRSQILERRACSVPSVFADQP